MVTLHSESRSGLGPIVPGLRIRETVTEGPQLERLNLGSEKPRETQFGSGEAPSTLPRKKAPRKKLFQPLGTASLVYHCYHQRHGRKE